MFRTTLGCSSRFTVLGSFLFFRNFFYYSKNFRGLVHCLVIIVRFVVVFLLSATTSISQHVRHRLSTTFFIFFKNFLNFISTLFSGALQVNTGNSLYIQGFCVCRSQRRILIYHTFFIMSTTFSTFFDSFFKHFFNIIFSPLYIPIFNIYFYSISQYIISIIKLYKTRTLSSPYFLTYHSYSRSLYGYTFKTLSNHPCIIQL